MKSYKTTIQVPVTYTYEAASNRDGDYDLFQIDHFIIGNTDLVSVLPEDYLESLDAALYEYLKGINND